MRNADGKVIRIKVLSSPVFSDEAKAREFIERIRWPHGPACVHCGEAERVNRLNGKSTKPGTLKCYSCRKLFTVTTGTIFHSSHIPLNKWLAAIYLMASSKKGISANQLRRELEITYKSAWFLCHRVRECMKLEPLASMLSGLVESDETYIGGKAKGTRTASTSAAWFTSTSRKATSAC